MVSFKEALKLVDIRSQSVQLLSLHSLDKDCRPIEYTFTLKELTNRLDLSKIFVSKIDYSCDRYDGAFLHWDFWICDSKGWKIDLIELYRKVRGKV